MLKIMSRLLAALVFVLCVASPANEVYAHGVGLTFSATSTTEGGAQYQVDVDYADLVIVENRLGRFDFNLFTDATREKAVSYTDVWVRIKQKVSDEESRTVFAGSLAHASIGGTGFSYVFPDDGVYTLSARYNDASVDAWGETIAEAEFELTVEESIDQKNRFGLPPLRTEFVFGALLGLCVAFLSVALLYPRLKKILTLEK